MTTEEILTYIEKFKNSHLGLSDTTFIIFDTQEEAFPDAPEGWNSNNITSGAYYPASNTIIIVSENHNNIKDLNKTIRHEVFGHLAINRLSETDKYNLLKTITEASSDSWVGKYRDYLSMTSYKYLKDNPFMLAEEVFANTAELSFAAIEPYKSIPDPTLIESKEDLLDIIDSIRNGIHYGVLKQKIFPKTNDAQFKIDKTAFEEYISFTIESELERTESLSDDTKERIHAYGSLMEDKALMDAVRSTDSEDLAALGEYFQELSQNDYVDYDTFGNNQIQEMR